MTYRTNAIPPPPPKPEPPEPVRAPLWARLWVLVLFRIVPLTAAVAAVVALFVFGSWELIGVFAGIFGVPTVIFISFAAHELTNDARCANDAREREHLVRLRIWQKDHDRGEGEEP